MRNTRLLQSDNRYHDGSGQPLSPSSGFSNEFDYDDPEIDYDDPEVDFDDLFSDSDELIRDESELRFLRDFILSCALYVEELECALCDRSEEFWEAREHAYRIITGLLVDVFRYELAGD